MNARQIAAARRRQRAAFLRAEATRVVPGRRYAWTSGPAGALALVVRVDGGLAEVDTALGRRTVPTQHLASLAPIPDGAPFEIVRELS